MKIAHKPLFTDIPRPAKFCRIPTAKAAAVVEPKIQPVAPRATPPSILKLSIPEVITGGDAQVEPKREDKGGYAIESLDSADYQ